MSIDLDARLPADGVTTTGRPHRRPRHLPLICGAVVAAIGIIAGVPAPAAADDPPDLVIDGFDVDQPALQVECPAPDPIAAFLTGPEILGGELDLSLSCDATGTGPARASVGSSGLTLDNSATPPGFVVASWDGPDNAPGLDPTGLGGIDLTSGGTKDSLEFDIAAITSPTTIDITVFTDASNFSSAFASVTTTGSVSVPLLGWFPSGSGADFTDVGAIVIAVDDGPEAGVVTIGSVHTTSAARATMTDALVGDIDADGQADPGDTIEYTVAIDNPAHPISVPVDDAAFALAPSTGGAVVPGSLTTTQGTVTSGNDPADTDLAVDLGSIADGAGATITYRVVIQGTGDLANQGVLTYSIVAGDPVPVSIATRTETDDPDTAAFSDETITAVAAPPASTTTTAAPSTTTTAPPDSIAPPPTTVALAPTIAGTLPATGSGSGGLAIAALACLGLGAALTVTVRRRHI